MVKRVVLVHSDRGQSADGIRDNSRQLAKELGRHEVDAELRLIEAGEEKPRNWVRACREMRRLGPDAAVVLQYNPFCFARWGFAPWLLPWLLAIRAARGRPTIAVMVHEPYMPMENWRWALMGLWQRAQLAGVRLIADLTFTSIEPWVESLSASFPRGTVHHLPIGSNLPDSRAEREEEKRRLGAAEGSLVLATVGRDHQSWLGDYVVEAANSIAATGRPVVLLNLGATAPALDGLDPGVSVELPGFLEDRDLARKLAASDVYLAPLIDGISTRRSAVMAALQNAAPVVATRGPLTDPVFIEADGALALAPVGDREEFAAAAVRLAGDPERRASTGAAARELYERHFAWPVIARNFLADLKR